jgi:type II secretory pathway pseudopilin PulG
MSQSTIRDAGGVGLVEVLISIGILTAVMLGVAPMFVRAIRTNLAAHDQTAAVILATQKMEQLRALSWRLDDTGATEPPAVIDTSTDLSVDPPSTGGAGLTPSPPDTLEHNVSGYVDFLSAHGSWVGTGTIVPPAATYVRRWSIERLPADPDGTLVFQVLVTTVAAEASRTPAVRAAQRRLAGDVWLVSLRSRRTR